MPATRRSLRHGCAARRAGAWALAFFLAKGLLWLALAAGIGYVQT